MIIRQFIFLISLTVSHYAYSQGDIISFQINFDSFEVKVSSSPNHLSTKHIFDNGKKMLLVEYNLEQSYVVFANAKLIIRNANGSLPDTSNIETWNMPDKKRDSFIWRHDRIELDVTRDSGQIITRTIVDNGENAFELTYFFEKETLALTAAQDISRRFLDSRAKYDNYIANFVTPINNPRKADHKGHEGQYWVNDYLITIDDGTMQKIQGKTVRIIGKVGIRKGTASPDHERLFSNTGTELHAQGLPQDVKFITNPEIKIEGN